VGTNQENPSRSSLGSQIPTLEVNLLCARLPICSKRRRDSSLAMFVPSLVRSPRRLRQVALSNHDSCRELAGELLLYFVNDGELPGGDLAGYEQLFCIKVAPIFIGRTPIVAE
jgi:hypothetical protein